TYEGASGVRFSEEHLKFLSGEKFSWELESFLRNFLQVLFSEMIVDEPTSFRKYTDTGVTVRRIRISEQENESIEKNLNSIRGVDEIRSELLTKVKQALSGNTTLKATNPEAMAGFLIRLLRP